MKAKVLIQFFDNAAKKVRKPGEVFDLPVKRFNEIRNKGRYIEAVEDQKAMKV